MTSQFEMTIAHRLVQQNEPYKLAGMIIALAERLAKFEKIETKIFLEELSK